MTFNLAEELEESLFTMCIQSMFARHGTWNSSCHKFWSSQQIKYRSLSCVHHAHIITGSASILVFVILIDLRTFSVPIKCNAMLHIQSFCKKIKCLHQLGMFEHACIVFNKDHPFLKFINFTLIIKN